MSAGGAVLGAGAGLSIGQLLPAVPLWILPLTGLLLGIATALLLSRLFIILILVLGFSITFPVGLAAAAGWSQNDIGINKAKEALNKSLENPTDELNDIPTNINESNDIENLVKTLMLANQVKKFWNTIGQILNRITTAWKQLSTHPRNALIIAALVGLLTGVIFGSLAPKNSARMSTATLGTLIMFFAIHALITTHGSNPTNIISLNSQTICICMITLSLIGFILQITLSTKNTTNDNPK